MASSGQLRRDPERISLDPLDISRHSLSLEVSSTAASRRSRRHENWPILRHHQLQGDTGSLTCQPSCCWRVRSRTATYVPPWRICCASKPPPVSNTCPLCTLGSDTRQRTQETTRARATTNCPCLANHRPKPSCQASTAATVCSQGDHASEFGRGTRVEGPVSLALASWLGWSNQHAPVARTCCMYFSWRQTGAAQTAQRLGPPPSSTRPTS